MVKQTTYAGKTFDELNEKEMLEIIGGTQVTERGTPVIPILTKLTYAYCVSAVSGLLTFAVC